MTKPDERVPKPKKVTTATLRDLRRVLGQLDVITEENLGALAYLNTVATAELDDTAVTLGKIANIATTRLLGRTTAGTGVAEELTPTQVTAMLNAFTSGLQGLAPASGGGTANFLRADGTWALPPGGGGGGDNISVNGVAASDADFDDATPAAPASGVNVKWQKDSSAPDNISAHLAAGDVTNALLVDMVQATIKGRAVGAGTGDQTDLTPAQATAILDAFTSVLQGLVPASGGGTDNFLRADGTWDEPLFESFYQVWAEENAALAASTYEWAFGNGANIPSNRGVVVQVPSGYSCEMVGMTLCLNAGSATVDINLNGTLQGASAQIASEQAHKSVTFGTPLALVDEDVFCFHTVAAAGTSAPNVVTALIRLYK